MPKLYIQVGAGAGDRDPASGFRDGFSERVKSFDLPSDARVILVEPNALCLPALQESWRGVPQAEIYAIGLTPKSENRRSLHFFYSTDDGPYFQLCSTEQTHVAKFFAIESIRSFSAPCEGIADWLPSLASEGEIELICFDVEGLDFELVTAVDWSLIRVHQLSVETIHMGEDEARLCEYLRGQGLRPCGFGVDVNGLDRMFCRHEGTFASIKGSLADWRYRIERLPIVSSLRGRWGTIRQTANPVR